MSNILFVKAPLGIVVSQANSILQSEPIGPAVKIFGQNLNQPFSSQTTSLFLIIILLKLVQLSRALDFIFIILLGISIEVNEVQPDNKPLDNCVNEAVILNVFKLAQSWKALSPILTTLLLSTNSSTLLQLLNA